MQSMKMALLFLLSDIHISWDRGLRFWQPPSDFLFLTGWLRIFLRKLSVESFYHRIFDLLSGYCVAVGEKNIFAANANSLQNVRIWCNIALPNLDFSQCTLKYASLMAVSC